MANVFTLDLLHTPATVVQLDKMPDVLVQVEYRLCGCNERRYAYRKGTALFNPPAPDVFIPYKSLTSEMVKDWVALVAATEIDVLRKEIEDELALPLTEFKELPWLAPEGGSAYFPPISVAP